MAWVLGGTLGGLALLVSFLLLSQQVFVVEPVLALLQQIAYAFTYASLVVCLCTVVGALLWYPRVRKRFSSPVRHAGTSVARLVLMTAVLVAVVQVSLSVFLPSLVYQISFILFAVSLAMFAARNVANLVAAYVHKRQERREGRVPLPNEPPLVTVVVPAFNEERAIGRTAEALLGLTYTRKEILIVDDGSTDDTLQVARSYAKGDGLTVLTKPNGGKWDALNTGINVARGDFVVCIDADTVLTPDAIQHLVKHFHNPEVGAVAGNVKVGNRQGLITRLQALEYVVGINLHRRSEASLQRVTVVPGPVGAFRKSVLQEAGLFEGDTFAEDADITLKILKTGYKTVFEARAIGYTEAPESMTGLAKQRYRWYRGSLQSLQKHKDMTFNRKYGVTGNFVMPWAMFNGVVYPWFMFFTLMWLLVFCFNPISPYTIYQPRMAGGPPGWTPGGGPPSGGPGPPSGPPGSVVNIGITIDLFQAIPYVYVFWFFIFILFEVAVAAYAISLDVKERHRLLIHAAIHRLSFTYVLDILRMLSQLEEVFHYPMKWEKMDHKGTSALPSAPTAVHTTTEPVLHSLEAL
jgi:cellulose synthase/poly-beta-1,6-N-acetylglucosamine synthase-like glycosyltransferase